MTQSADALNERQLVDVAKTGDEKALSELYSSYFPRVYRYILARTGNVNDAEDLTEEVFLRMLNAIERFQWREAPFSAWLFRIAHNAVISQRRRNGSRADQCHSPKHYRWALRARRNWWRINSL